MSLNYKSSINENLKKWHNSIIILFHNSKQKNPLILKIFSCLKSQDETFKKFAF